MGSKILYLILIFASLYSELSHGEVYFEPYGGWAMGDMPIVARRGDLARYTSSTQIIGPQLGAHVGWFEVYDVFYALNVETTLSSNTSTVDGRLTGDNQLSITKGNYTKVGIGMGYFAQNVPFGIHGYFDFFSTLNTFGPGISGNGFRLAGRYFPWKCCSLALQLDQGYLVKKIKDEYWGSNPTVLSLTLNMPFTFDYPTSKWRSRYAKPSD